MCQMSSFPPTVRQGNSWTIEHISFLFPDLNNVGSNSVKCCILYSQKMAFYSGNCTESSNHDWTNLRTNCFILLSLLWILYLFTCGSQRWLKRKKKMIMILPFFFCLWDKVLPQKVPCKTLTDPDKDRKEGENLEEKEK